MVTNPVARAIAVDITLNMGKIYTHCDLSLTEQTINFEPMAGIKDYYETLKSIEINGKDIVSAGYVSQVYVEEGMLHIRLSIPQEFMKHAIAIENTLKRVFKERHNIENIRVEIKPKMQIAPPKLQTTASGNIFDPKRIPGVKRVIGVGSGKGGVGKSTVAVNLAVKLAQKGYRVAIFDADIYGPSVGTLLGIKGQKIKVTKEKKFLPVEAYGIGVISFASLLDEDTPVIWRGTMFHKVYQDLFFNTIWSEDELDYLVIDFPPGTGDAQLSAAQQVIIDGVLVVTTPQRVAVDDVRRAINAFLKMEVPVLGLVENMSYIIDTCGNKLHIFGKGGGDILSRETGLPLVARIPLDPEYLEVSDEGRPMVIQEVKNENQRLIQEAYGRISDFILERVAP